MTIASGSQDVDENLLADVELRGVGKEARLALTRSTVDPGETSTLPSESIATSKKVTRPVRAPGGTADVGEEIPPSKKNQRPRTVRGAEGRERRRLAHSSEDEDEANKNNHITEMVKNNGKRARVTGAS